jgi:3'-phosphoadenosine 5'-phosphosulfate sulfotransferase (PAPS reductase)/FAD synthetase
MIPLDYDYYVVAFSGGKDSIASFLALVEAGVELSKIELWHHDIDGREDAEHLMDWPSTRAYCQAFARAFGVKIYFSWREGGFAREMLRQNTRTAPSIFETPDGIKSAGGTTGPLNTRRLFPQVTPDLSKRWCSAKLKIDVCDSALANQPRFKGKRTLVISGERAQESAARARYAEFEPDRTNCQSRHVDRLRPVHKWTEDQVWAIIERHRINMHPAYRLGWGRLSCLTCIFGNSNQWASARAVAPGQFNRIAAYEAEFGKTIDRQGKTVCQKAALGVAYAATRDPALVAEANDVNWSGSIRLATWVRPAGAFGESCGPI